MPIGWGVLNNVTQSAPGGAAEALRRVARGQVPLGRVSVLPPYVPLVQWLLFSLV